MVQDRQMEGPDFLLEVVQGMDSVFLFSFRFLRLDPIDVWQ